MVFLWFSYGFPMVFLWFSYGFPMVFLWFTNPGAFTEEVAALAGVQCLGFLGYRVVQETRSIAGWVKMSKNDLLSKD